MPINVPVYTQKVGTASLPGVRQSGADPVSEALGRVGQSISNLGSEAAGIVKKVTDEQDEAAVQDAYAKLSSAKQAYLDGPNGITTLKGKDALDEHESFVKAFNTDAADIRDKLTSDSQRQRFAPVFESQKLEFLDSVDRHVAQQADVLADQSFQSALGAAKSDAAGAASRGETGAVASAIGTGLGVIDQRAKSQGWGADFTAQAHRQFSTETYINVLDTLVEQGRSGEARAYLDHVKQAGDYDASMLAKSNIEKIVHAATVRDDARVVADGAWKDAGGDPAKAEELLRAKDIKDTALFDDALQRVQQHGSEMAQARRQADSPRLGRLEQQILATGHLSQNSDDFVRLSDEGKADAMRMAKAEQRSRHASSSEDRRIQNEVDKQAESDFRKLVAEQPGAALQVDVTARYPDASVRQRNMISVLRADAEKDMRSGRAVPRSEFLADATLQAKNNGITDPDKINALKEYLEKSYQDWLDDPANERFKQPKQDWARKAIGDALLYGQKPQSAGSIVPGFLFDATHRNKYRFETTPGEEWSPFAKQEQGVQQQTAPAAAAATPTSTDKIRVRKPDGTTGSMPAGKATDDWLAAHPDYSRVQ